MNLEQWWDDNGRESRSTRRKTSPSATLSVKNLSTLTFICTLLLPEGQTGGVREPFKSKRFFGNREHWIEKYFPLGQGWRTFLRARAQIVYKFGINSFAYHENFEDQNKVLQPSIIIIIIIIISLFLLVHVIIMLYN